MANPLISIGVSGSGRYAPPNFAPLAQGMTQLGGALGHVFQQRREKAEQEKKNAARKAAFANVKSPADLLALGRNDPELLNDPATANFLRVMQAAMPGQTTDDKNYASYKADQEARGLPVLPLFEWGQQRRKAGASSVTVNSGKTLTSDAQRTIRGALGTRKLAELNKKTKDGRTLFEILASPQAMIPKTLLGAKIPGRGYVQSDDFLKAEQLMTEMIADILYLKSGAQAGESEIEGNKATYMPQPGDGPKVIAAKMAALQEFADTAAKAAGVSLDRFNTGQRPTAAGGSKPPAVAPKPKTKVPPPNAADRAWEGVKNAIGLGGGKKPAARPTSAPAATPPPKSKKPEIPTDFTGLSIQDLAALGDRVNDMDAPTLMRYLEAMDAAASAGQQQRAAALNDSGVMP